MQFLIQAYKKFNHYRQQTVLPPLLLLLCIVGIFLNISRLGDRTGNGDAPADFRNVYLGAKLVLKGKIPYNDSLIKKEWAACEKNPQLRYDLEPGFPTMPVLYPPWAFTCFFPFAVFPFDLSGTLYTVLLTLGILIACWFLAGSFRHKSVQWVVALDLLLILIAFKGMGRMVGVSGQPVILTFIFLSFFYAARKNKHFTAAGIFLAIAALKITVAFPFIVFLILKKEFKILIPAIITGICLFTPVLILTHDPLILMQGFFDTIHQFRLDSINRDPIFMAQNHFPDMSTEIGFIIKILWPQHTIVIPIILSILALVSLQRLSCWIKNPIHNDSLILAILICLEFLCNHHFSYDCISLIFFYPLIIDKNNLVVRWGSGIFLALSIIPFSAVLWKLQIPLTVYLPFFNYALFITLLWGTVIFSPYATKQDSIMLV